MIKIAPNMKVLNAVQMLLTRCQCNAMHNLIGSWMNWPFFVCCSQILPLSNRCNAKYQDRFFFFSQQQITILFTTMRWCPHSVWHTLTKFHLILIHSHSYSYFHRSQSVVLFLFSFIHPSICNVSSSGDGIAIYYVCCIPNIRLI